MSPNVVLIIVNSAEAEVMQPKVPVQVVFGIKMIKNQTVPLQLFVWIDSWRPRQYFVNHVEKNLPGFNQY